MEYQFSLIDDSILHGHVDKQSYNNDFYYYKVLFMVKMWCGEHIKKEDLSVLTPVFSIYLQHIIKKKFGLDIDLHLESIEDLLSRIRQIRVKKEHHHVSVLFKFMFRKLKRLENLKNIKLFDRFYECYF